MPAGKRIMIILWNLKTLLPVSGQPVQAVQGRNGCPTVVFSILVHRNMNPKSARLQGYEEVKFPQGAQPKFSPIPVLSLSTYQNRAL